MRPSMGEQVRHGWMSCRALPEGVIPRRREQGTCGRERIEGLPGRAGRVEQARGLAGSILHQAVPGLSIASQLQGCSPTMFLPRLAREGDEPSTEPAGNCDQRRVRSIRPPAFHFLLGPLIALDVALLVLGKRSDPGLLSQVGVWLAKGRVAVCFRFHGRFS